MNAGDFWKRTGLLVAGMLLASCASAPDNAPAGSTTRTLAQAEVDALLSGKGMGMAAVAEINGYPGPMHVLELKEELDLTPDQRFATSRLVGLTQGRARALGRRIVDAEKRLDEVMSKGDVSGSEIRSHVQAIAALHAQLRFAHLNAHLEQKSILTPEQVRRYYELRGRQVVVPATPAGAEDAVEEAELMSSVEPAGR